MSNQLSEETRNLYAEVKKLLLENRDLRMRNDEAKDKFIEDERVFSWVHLFKYLSAWMCLLLCMRFREYEPLTWAV